MPTAEERKAARIEERKAARIEERRLARIAERVVDRKALAAAAKAERIEQRKAERRAKRVAARKLLRALQSDTKPTVTALDDEMCITKDRVIYRGVAGRWYAVSLLDDVTWLPDVATVADLPEIDPETGGNHLILVGGNVLSSHNGESWVAPDFTALQDTDIRARNTVIEDRIDAVSI